MFHPKSTCRLPVVQFGAVIKIRFCLDVGYSLYGCHRSSPPFQSSSVVLKWLSHLVFCLAPIPVIHSGFQRPVQLTAIQSSYPVKSSPVSSDPVRFPVIRFPVIQSGFQWPGPASSGPVRLPEIQFLVSSYSVWVQNWFPVTVIRYGFLRPSSVHSNLVLFPVSSGPARIPMIQFWFSWSSSKWSGQLLLLQFGFYWSIPVRFPELQSSFQRSSPVSSDPVCSFPMVQSGFQRSSWSPVIQSGFQKSSPVSSYPVRFQEIQSGFQMIQCGFHWYIRFPVV